MTSTRTRTGVLDSACAHAVEPARAAAADVVSLDLVGEHLGVQVEGDRVVTHFFDCLHPAYPGWRVAVTVMRAARAKDVTVGESLLLPGGDALLAPAWVPWSDRLRPGDVGVGDLLPTPADDSRLVPGHARVDEESDTQLPWGLDLARPRVLSPIGREAAATRWYDADAGPYSKVAAAAPAPCATCGFFVPLAGPFRRVFGVCANEYAPDDGNVVSVDHGCGAHSEALIPTTYAPAPPIVGEPGYEPLEGTDDPPAGTASDGGTP